MEAPHRGTGVFMPRVGREPEEHQHQQHGAPPASHTPQQQLQQQQLPLSPENSSYPADPRSDSCRVSEQAHRQHVSAPLPPPRLHQVVQPLRQQQQQQQQQQRQFQQQPARQMQVQVQQMSHRPSAQHTNQQQHCAHQPQQHPWQQQAMQQQQQSYHQTLQPPHVPLQLQLVPQATPTHVQQQQHPQQQQQQLVMLSPAASLDAFGVDASDLNRSFALLQISNSSSSGHTNPQQTVAADGTVSCSLFGSHGVLHQSSNTSFDSGSGSMRAVVGLGVPGAATGSWQQQQQQLMLVQQAGTCSYNSSSLMLPQQPQQQPPQIPPACETLHPITYAGCGVGAAVISGQYSAGTGDNSKLQGIPPQLILAGTQQQQQQQQQLFVSSQLSLEGIQQQQLFVSPQLSLGGTQQQQQQQLLAPPQLSLQGTQQQQQFPGQVLSLNMVQQEQQQQQALAAATDSTVQLIDQELARLLQQRNIMHQRRQRQRQRSADEVTVAAACGGFGAAYNHDAVFSAGTLSGHCLFDSNSHVVQNLDHNVQGTCSPYTGSRRSSGATSAPTFIDHQTKPHEMSQEAAAAVGSMCVSTAEPQGRVTETAAQLASSTVVPLGAIVAFSTAGQTAAGPVLAGGLSPTLSAAFFGDTASVQLCEEQQQQQQRSTAEDVLYLLPNRE